MHCRASQRTATSSREAHFEAGVTGRPRLDRDDGRLEKDRTRRYETANGFAADIQRHLAYEPVVAAPPSRAYRLRKFSAAPRRGDPRRGLVLVTAPGRPGRRGGWCRRWPTPGLAASLTRETNANAAPEQEANGRLSQIASGGAGRGTNSRRTRSRRSTPGSARISLLTEEKSDDLRNRLLNSAGDFYGRLGALLGKETDLASRRALSQANFELAELTDKVGEAGGCAGRPPAGPRRPLPRWRLDRRPIRRSRPKWGAA